MSLEVIVTVTRDRCKSLELELFRKKKRDPLETRLLWPTYQILATAVAGTGVVDAARVVLQKTVVTVVQVA